MAHRKDILRKKDKPNKTPVSLDTDPLLPAPLKCQDILNDTTSKKTKKSKGCESLQHIYAGWLH